MYEEEYIYTLPVSDKLTVLGIGVTENSGSSRLMLEKSMVCKKTRSDAGTWPWMGIGSDGTERN